jgi:hypothetical protein
MIGDPGEDLGLFVGGVIVGDGMDDLFSGDGSFDRIQKLDNRLTSMLFHAEPYDGSVQYVEGCGLAGFVVQKAIYALLAISLLPTPDGGATDPGPPRHFQQRQLFGEMQDNLGPLNVLQGAMAIDHNRKQLLVVFGMLKNIEGLCHDARFAYLATLANPMIASAHYR